MTKLIPTNRKIKLTQEKITKIGHKKICSCHAVRETCPKDTASTKKEIS
jgi:hypothetical protein